MTLREWLRRKREREYEARRYFNALVMALERVGEDALRLQKENNALRQQLEGCRHAQEED